MTQSITAPPAAVGTNPILDTALPPHALLWDLATVAVVSRCLHAVAQHGVADALEHTGGTVEDLAARVNLNADALGRVLRALAVYGVFEVALPEVRHTDASRLLRTDHPRSMVLEAYDFAAHGTVADIGGGRGHFLHALVERHPGVEATLVELPGVIDRVAGESDDDRLRLVTADFFTDTLPPADAYVLMEIIHDWDDTDAVRILSNIRRSAPDHAVVLVIETVLDDDRVRDPARTLDIVMLALTGGRERTPAEYASLFEGAGFEFARLITTGGGVQLVEARPVARTTEAP